MERGLRRKVGLYEDWCDTPVPHNTNYEREKYWIEYYNSFYQGYNKTKGGSGEYYVNPKVTVEDVKINSISLETIIGSKYLIEE